MLQPCGRACVRAGVSVASPAEQRYYDGIVGTTSTGGKTNPKSNPFDVYYSRGWVYLVVSSGAVDVYSEDIENRMRLLGMPKVRASVLRQHIEEASGEAVQLVQWPEGRRLASRITVEISDDEMTATITVTAPQRGAAPPTPADVEKALTAQGVTTGVDHVAIATALRERRYDTPIVAAAGHPPVFGTARRLEYRFKQDRGKPYLHMPFDRINLKELNFIDNKKEGDLLAVLLPPVKPVNGSTVTGDPIPATRDTTQVAIPAGENTRFNTDRTKLYAACDGNARFRDGLIVVEPVIEVENVNYETGNIHFDGSVVIHGSVADGFTVEAGGTIQVGKSVGRAHLKAGENILLQSGMNGGGGAGPGTGTDGSALLECGGNLFARYLESTTVRCKGNIFVEEAIMHSTITTWNHCILNGRRAECIGGEFIIGGSLWCRKLGSQYDAPTHVAIGIPPELVEAYRTAKNQLDTAEDQLEILEDKLHRIENAIEHTDEDHPKHKYLAAREQLRIDITTTRAQTDTLRRRVPALRERLDPSATSIVVAEDIIYNGVTITFGKKEYRAPQTGTRTTILRMTHNDIHVDGFNRHTPPTLDFTLPV